MPAESADGFVDQDTLRECIETQRCPWCQRAGLRSLANHTVRAHGVYADDLRELAGLPPKTPLCSPELSECHRELALEQDSTEWLHRPEVRLAGAAVREANYNDEQRRRRVEQLNAVRPKATEAFRRSLRAEKDNPELAAARRIARSKAHRAFREGAECPICGFSFCSVVAPGQDYRQRKFCSITCRLEGHRRVRRRMWLRQKLETAARQSPEAGRTNG
jgi:hypothetical protein